MLQDRSLAEALTRKSLPGVGEWLSRDSGSTRLNTEDLARQSQRRLSEGVGEAAGIEERNEVVQADKLLQSPCTSLFPSSCFKISTKLERCACNIQVLYSWRYCLYLCNLLFGWHEFSRIQSRGSPILPPTGAHNHTWSDLCPRCLECV